MRAEMISNLHSWAGELTARANRVRNLIGDTHWLSDGHHKEYIVRDFLARHLRQDHSITRGFICPPDSEVPSSGEIDILVSDPGLQPPWFNEGHLIIAPPASILAQIHVKTTFSSSELIDALSACKKAYATCDKYIDSSQLWSGIFFFGSRLPNDQLELSLISWLGYFLADHPNFVGRFFPNCIAVLDGPVIFFDKSSLGSEKSGSHINMKIRAFHCAELSAAVMFADLSEHLRCFSNHSVGKGALSHLIEKSAKILLFNKTFQLKAKARRSRRRRK